MVYIAVFVFGLLLGSFVNALVWRVHEQTRRKNPRTHADELSILRGRSMCPHCRHSLHWKDLVPVFSWLTLKGRCRYCRKTIGAQYPAVELLSGALFVVSALFWPYDWSVASAVLFVAWLVMVTGLLALAVYDLKWMLLPNRLLYPQIVLAAGMTLVTWTFLDADISVLGLLASVFVAGGVFYILFVISDGTWIGGGDVKYGLLAGILLADPMLAFLNLMLASLLGSTIIISGVLAGRLSLKSKVPFGPFLIAGTFIIYLFGTEAVEWYRSALLIAQLR